MTGHLVTSAAVNSQHSMLAALLRGTAAPAAAVVGGTACMHTLSVPRGVKQRQKAATCSAISHACWEQANQQQQQPAGLINRQQLLQVHQQRLQFSTSMQMDILAEHRQHQQQLLQSGWPCMRQLPRCFAAAAAHTQGDCLQHGWHNSNSSSSSTRAGALLCQPYSKLAVSSSWVSQHGPWQGPRWYASNAHGCSAEYVLDYVHTQYPSTQQSSSAQARNQSGSATGQSLVHKSASTATVAAAPPLAAGAADATAQCAINRAPTAVPAADPSTGPRGRVVAVAVSGGVDSAVSALLLQQQGYQLFGVYMHNWDAADEAGAGTPTCTSEADLADAQALCKALDIPLYEADFVSRYWNEVFETFLQGLSQGVTPNPDLACNSHIKFGALLQFAREKGADLLATGHYARLGWERTAAGPAAAVTAGTKAAAGSVGGGDATASRTAGSARVLTSGSVGSGMGQVAAAETSSAPTAADAGATWRPVLLTGCDSDKDQTYFLASLTHQQLAQAMFPVGHLSKAQVREMAAAAGLSQATKRSSAGICFIGRRSFGKFLEAYLQPRPGVYVDAETDTVLGPCSNMLAVTVGQKARGLGGQKSRVFVVGKDLGRGVVHVAAGHEHPALYSSEVLLRAPNWVAGQPPAQLLSGDAGRFDRGPALLCVGNVNIVDNAAAEAAQVGQDVSDRVTAAELEGSAGVLRCQYQARYRQPAAECSVYALTAAEAAAFEISKFCSAVPLALSAAGCKLDSAASSTHVPAGDIAAHQVLAAPVSSPGQGFDMQRGCAEFLVAELSVPLRGIAPGQMFVLYNGEVCLGSATIVAHGPTLAEKKWG